ncbi:MAG TPA: hypothetical protein PKM27_04875 [Saprospiraceae bacterium]|nr:hypothetical protein [Saprospiraceae bacterium]HNT20355.1 hypothetical protein [Saprospiraceae bacterium]
MAVAAFAGVDLLVMVFVLLPALVAVAFTTLAGAGFKALDGLAFSFFFAEAAPEDFVPFFALAFVLDVVAINN